MLSKKEVARITLDFYRKVFFPGFGHRYDFDNGLNTPDSVSDKIQELLNSSKPCMISRFGSTEFMCMLFFYRGRHPFWPLRKICAFWVPTFVKHDMMFYSGFFPSNDKLFSEFSDLLWESAKSVDLLGSWISAEQVIERSFGYDRCPLLYLEPYWSSHPWTESLNGKKVLVIHPFSETIISQYQNKRELLFSDSRILPKFKSLSIIKAVQSLGGDSNGFSTWYEALRCMEEQMDRIDYDVALIGCGAYGMPLAAHCKQMGKKAVHLGGALQLLFGIKGSRWEDPLYGSDFGLNYSEIINNPHWVKPGEKERPKSAQYVEDACYW